MQGESLIFIVGIFILYGLFSACTQGIAKAWISKVVNGKEVGSAIGNFEAFNSLSTMLASSIGGLVWYQFGAQVFLIGTSICAFFVLLYFVINSRRSLFESPV